MSYVLFVLPQKYLSQLAEGSLFIGHMDQSGSEWWVWNGKEWMMTARIQPQTEYQDKKTSWDKEDGKIKRVGSWKSENDMGGGMEGGSETEVEREQER